MKMLLTGLAVALMASAAVAQTTTPADPAAPAAMESAAAAPAAEPAAPAAASEAAAPSATTLAQRDGKWWNGDRRATKPEIAAWKKAQKAGVPS